MTSIQEEHPYLLEFIIKHIYVKPEYLSHPKNPDQRIRIRFGTKIDSEIQLLKLAPLSQDPVFNLNEFRGGLSFLVTMSAAELIDTLQSKPVRIIIYNCHGNQDHILCTCDKFLEQQLYRSILLYYNLPHVELTDYCADLKDSNSSTVGVVHVLIRISRLNDIIETEISSKQGQVSYKTARNQILSMTLSKEHMTGIAKRKSRCCCDEENVEMTISTKKEKNLPENIIQLNENMNKLMEKIINK
ncbi:hypothetical protein WDU94_014224 [Cyamophila willieti]